MVARTRLVEEALVAPDWALLRAMARIGRLIPRHVQILWHPLVTLNGVRRRLTKLEQLGVIAGITFMHPSPRRRGRYVPPKKGGLIYILTPLGVDLVRTRFPQEPLEYEKLIVRGQSTAHQAEHQIEYADVMVQILLSLTTIPGVVGLNSSAEMQLGEGRTPRCDGFLVLRRWLDGRPTGINVRSSIPWLKGPKEPGQIDRTYAIEVDRGTEEPAVIAGKARSYLAVYQSGWWKDRYQFPGTVFIVPDENRREVVIREWQNGWPSSPLLITTKPELDTHGLNAPIWIEQVRHQRRLRTFYDRWLEPMLEPPIEVAAPTPAAQPLEES